MPPAPNPPSQAQRTEIVAPIEEVGDSKAVPVIVKNTPLGVSVTNEKVPVDLGDKQVNVIISNANPVHVVVNGPVPILQVVEQLPQELASAQSGQSIEFRIDQRLQVGGPTQRATIGRVAGGWLELTLMGSSEKGWVKASSLYMIRLVP